MRVHWLQDQQVRYSPPGLVVSAALTGTATSGWTEAIVTTATRTIIITLTNTTWVASGATFDAQRQNILNGIDSAQSESNGWDAKLSTIPVTAVVRTSATVVTITVPIIPTYVVSANETLTVTVPGSAVAAGTAITATPTLTIQNSAPSAAVTGTATSGWYESEVVAGGDTIILTLTGENWVTAGAPFDAQRSAILAGITAATSPATGWNALKSGIAVTSVVRTSATVVTITLPAIGTYSVAASETLTVTIPGAAVSGGSPVVASPTLTITEGTAPTGPTFTDDGTYIRTWEPVTATCLLADDFSTGEWYALDGDHSGTPAGTLTHGWVGNIYENPITPAGAVQGGGVGLHGRPYAASSGFMDGTPGGRNMAQHWFKVQGQTEVYCRYYFKPSADYDGGHEKMFDIIDTDSGGGMVVLTYNYFGVEAIRSIPYIHQDDGLPGPPVGGAWMAANVGAVPTITPGHWHYLEHRCVLNTPGSYDGIYELWFDDCGVDGTSGPATPTKRMSYTNVMFRGAAESSVRCNGIWIENWGNPGSTGTLLYANVYCDTQFVGFADPADQA